MAQRGLWKSKGLARGSEAAPIDHLHEIKDVPKVEHDATVVARLEPGGSPGLILSSTAPLVPCAIRYCRRLCFLLQQPNSALLPGLVSLPVWLVSCLGRKSTEGCAMLRLYDSLLSGNSWKVRILLSQLHLRYERVTLDLARGDTPRPDFRKISRFSRIPALMIDDGRTIVESGAILTYLAEGTDLLPADSYLPVEVLSWLFFEQADLQKAIAISRVYHLRGQAAQRADEIRHRQNDGYAALDHLGDR